MAIENWTDRDYAQAAIDMLPDGVEEIAEFLRAQGIKGRRKSGTGCPIARWVQLWTGRDDSYMGVYNVYPAGYPDEPHIGVPKAVVDFVRAYDSGGTTL